MDLFGKNREESKSLQGNKTLKRADTNFSLQHSNTVGVSSLGNVAITLDDLDKFNEKQEISGSILDLTLQSREADFKEKEIKVLTNHTLEAIRTETGDRHGEILKEGVNGSAFDFNSVVLPYVQGDVWELVVLCEPQQLFKDNFTKLKEGISSVVSSIGSFFGGSKKQAKEPRLLHLYGDPYSRSDKENLYKAINLHFKAVFPGSNITEYLKYAGSSDIGEDALPYQPVHVVSEPGETNRGGEFIYAFLQRVFLDERDFPTDKNEIEMKQFFLNNRVSSGDIVGMLKDLPGTKVEEGWDGSIKVGKDPEFEIEESRMPRESLRQGELEIFVDNQMQYYRPGEEKDQGRQPRESLQQGELEIFVDNQMQFYRPGEEKPDSRPRGSSLEIYVDEQLVCYKNRTEYFIQYKDEDAQSEEDEGDADSVRENQLFIQRAGTRCSIDWVDDDPSKFRTQALPNARTKKREHQYIDNNQIGEPSKDEEPEYNAYNGQSPLVIEGEFDLPVGHKKKKIDVNDASQRQGGCCSSCSIF